MIGPRFNFQFSELPELPERFGNPLLRGSLVEIDALGGIDWVPQTPGWYALALLFAGWSGWRLWHRLRHWLRNRYRREALKRLRAVQPSPSLEALNSLLKITAIVASSRKEVAPLTGDAWCQWLQSRTPEPIFSDSSIHLLGEAVYHAAAGDVTHSTDRHSDESPDQGSLSALLNEIERWIHSHQDDHAPA